MRHLRTGITQLPFIRRKLKPLWTRLFGRVYKHGRKRRDLRPVYAGTLAVMLILSLIAWTGRAHAASQGPLSPATASGWTSSGNVTASDGLYASASISSSSTSAVLSVTGFGFTIPTGSTINGVTASVQKYAPSNSKATIEDASVQLIKGGAAGGTSQATATAWPTSDTSVSYGSSSNLWGQTLAVSDVNASNFGIALSAKNVKSGGGATNTAYVDYVSLTVYYTPPPIAYNQASYRFFNNQDATSSAIGSKADYAISGTNPKSITTADVNGDGHPDIITADPGDGSISVLLNNGNGTFGSDIGFIGSQTYSSVSVADVDGDGKPDIVAASQTSAQVAVFLGSGNGYFGTETDYTIASLSYAVTTADVNGDGHPDIIAADDSTSSVTVLLNSGSGTFTATADYTTDATPESVITADVNGDGHPDIITGNPGIDSLSVLLNNGDGTFASQSNYMVGGMSVSSIAAGDLNGDGYPDIVTANPGDGTISVIMNNGDGTFMSPGGVNTSANRYSTVSLADIDGDGKLDIVAASETQATVIVLPGNGDGTFGTETDHALASYSYAATTADVNGDGHPDIIAADYTANSVSVLPSSTGPIDVGAGLAAQNTAATVPGDGQPFRLRLDIGITGAAMTTNFTTFKLQYAPMTTSCDTTFTNTPASAYQDVTDTTPVRYYDNPLASSGSALANATSPTDGTNPLVPETYLEKGTTTFTDPTSIAVGSDGMWDFALTTGHTLQNTHYCLRVVQSSGTALDSYSVIPEIILPSASLSQSSYRFFQPGGSAPITFAKAYGSTGNDIANAVVQTTDGGYATTGYVENMSQSLDYMSISKYASDGKLTWTKTWGTSTGNTQGNAIVQTADGGYVVAGLYNQQSSCSPSCTDTSSAFLAKYDSSGNLLWSTSLTEGIADTDILSLINTSDGGFAVTGYTNIDGTSGDDVFIAKYSSSGGLTWFNLWGTANDDHGEAIVQTSDGGYAITGYSYNSGKVLLLAKFSSTGANIWASTWNVLFSSTEGTALLQTSDGGFAVTGFTRSSGSVDDAVLLRFTNSGSLTWSEHWGGSANEEGYAITQTTDGNFVIAGETTSYGSSGGIFVLKYDDTGLGSWAQTWDGGASESATALGATADGGVIVAGWTYSYGAGGEDGLLLKYDSTGSMAGCNSTMCQSQSASASVYSGSAMTSGTLSLAATPLTPTVTNSPTATAASATLTTTIIVDAPAPIGAPLVAQNTSYDVPKTGVTFRLRLLLRTSYSGLNTNAASLKLQYAAKSGSCSTSTYYDVTTSSPLAWADETGLTNGQGVGASTDDPVDGSNPNDTQTYQTANNFTNSSSPLYAKEDGLWDFSLVVPIGSQPGLDICLRVVNASGTTLSSYEHYPEIQFGPANSHRLRLGQWFDNNETLQPFFIWPPQ